MPGIRQKLLDLGFKTVSENVREHNYVFDTPGLHLKNDNKLLRLRQSGNACVLTFKRPDPNTPRKSIDKIYKIREEIEVTVSDFDKAETIFKGLGYEVFFIYEKYREELTGPDGEVEIMLDHTPVGDFIEIEGPAPEIDRVAVLLGFSKEDYITSNYYKLWRKEHPEGHMVFE